MKYYSLGSRGWRHPINLQTSCLLGLLLFASALEANDSSSLCLSPVAFREATFLSALFIGSHSLMVSPHDE